MSIADVKCPCCGAMNRNLLLRETRGWMECDKCGKISRHPGKKHQPLRAAVGTAPGEKQKDNRGGIVY